MSKVCSPLNSLKSLFKLKVRTFTSSDFFISAKMCIFAVEKNICLQKYDLNLTIREFFQFFLLIWEKKSRKMLQLAFLIQNYGAYKPDICLNLKKYAHVNVQST